MPHGNEMTGSPARAGGAKQPPSIDHLPEAVVPEAFRRHLGGVAVDLGNRRHRVDREVLLARGAGRRVAVDERRQRGAVVVHGDLVGGTIVISFDQSADCSARIESCTAASGVAAPSVETARAPEPKSAAGSWFDSRMYSSTV